ncbi:hypothetical protein Tco_1039984, partial [Tanacetum coccineum]
EVKVERQFDCGLLSSITVIRADGKVYTFKEFYYRQLNLNDIEAMYVLKAQGKLHHLRGQAEYDLANSLLIYIRSEVIKKRVEDVHLGVESYQKSLNLTKPKFVIPRIHEYPANTMYADIKKINRFMGIHEVFKFCDGTIKGIYEELESTLRINRVGTTYEHLNNRKWTDRDVRRSRRMMRKIEEILKERRKMRRLESYVGGRPNARDIRLFARLE